MRKKTDKELGVVLPESMVDTIANKKLTDEQVGRIVRAVIWNSMECHGDIVCETLVATLVGTYRGANAARIKKIKASRESKKEYEKKRREKANIVEDAILKSVKENMEFHGIVGKVRLGNNSISPYNPPAGDEKSSSAKAEGHAPSGKRTTTGPRRTTTGDGTTKRLKSKPGTTAAPATREDQPSASRGAATSKKTTGAGLWDGAAVVVNAAEAMMARHPNAKSSKRAVVRAIAATVEEEPGEPPATVDAIGAAHAAWCATDGWSEENGPYVQALAAWIRNGGWRKLPPQKKKPAPPKGDEISFDASL